MLRLASSWVWDFWLADDGERHHLFFLKASRALLDPNRRHWRATVGHAVSTDLTSWTELPDALVAGEEPAYDDMATWTGSVVQAPDGSWRMFYTGIDRASGGTVQRILCARSADLLVWERTGLVVEADPRWYELVGESEWGEQHWRDPWVYADPAGDGWHMLVTARARQGDAWSRGVVGHATSADLVDWTVQPPLSTPAGFGQLEVMQVAHVEGRWVLLFSCLGPELSEQRCARESGGGIWAVNVTEPTGPFDIESAYRLHDETLYVGRLVQDRAGSWQLMAFGNDWATGRGGEIADPVPVAWDGGRLVVRD